MRQPDRLTSKNGWMWRWGKLMARRKGVVLLLWIVLVAAFAVKAAYALDQFTDSGFTPEGSESEASVAILQKELGLPTASMNAVFVSDTLDLTAEAQRQAILKAVASVRKLPYVTDVRLADFTRNPGKTGVQVITLGISKDINEIASSVPDIRAAIQAPPGMKVYVTGGPPVVYDMQTASKRDIVKAESIGLPIALLVLLAVFGTIPAALLPLFIGLASVSVTMGVVGFIGDYVQLANMLPNMITMLGLAVGLDYALFSVSRFREELRRRGGRVEEAVAATSATAGRSILFSGLAVLIGLYGMSFIHLSIFKSLSIGGVLVVSVSVIAANTLLLALLALFGERLNALRIMPKRTMSGSASPLWGRVAYAVMRKPLLLAILIAAVMLTCMAPLRAIILGVPSAEVLPPKYDSRMGADLLKDTFDKRETNPFQIAVRLPGAYDEPASIAAMRAIEQDVRGIEGVKAVRSYAALLQGLGDQEAAQALKSDRLRTPVEQGKLAKGSTALLAVTPTVDPDSEAANAVLQKLRALQPKGTELLVGGGPAYRYDIVDRIESHMGTVILFVTVVTYIVLLAAFRSILLPLKAVLMNVLSLGASMGIVVSVFQNGAFAGALHITSTGYVNATVPVVIFCVVFGISMDYEVFMLSRIAEEYEATGDNDRSTAEALIRTGGLITSAALILIVVVGSFIVTDIEIMKALGLGLGLAVLLDATIIRVAMVPALMKLLGPANWWAPKVLRPIRPAARRLHTKND